MRTFISLFCLLLLVGAGSACSISGVEETKSSISMESPPSDFLFAQEEVITYPTLSFAYVDTPDNGCFLCISGATKGDCSLGLVLYESLQSCASYAILNTSISLNDYTSELLRNRPEEALGLNDGYMIMRRLPPAW